MVQQDINQKKEMVDMKLPFPWKLHKLLEETEEKNTNDIVAWLPDDASFKVHQTKAFTEEIMPHYFSQTKYNSFRRQCYIYGFRLRRDGAFYHPQFRRDDLEGSLSLRRNQETDRRKKLKSGRETKPKKKPSQKKSSFALPPRPSCLSLPKAPSMTAHCRPTKAALSLFEHTFEDDHLTEEVIPRENISALADEIFENNQFVSRYYDDFLSLDGKFEHVPLASLNEMFLSEICENQPEQRYSGSNIQVVSI
jgi:hypothetical protein